MSRKTTYDGADDRGSSAVEFALVVPLLVTLIVGMIQFGVVYNAYLGVTHAAREGARMAAVGQYTVAAVKAASPQLDPAKVQISESEASGYCQVVVTYPYKLEIPFVPAQSLSLTSTARMRKE